MNKLCRLDLLMRNPTDMGFTVKRRWFATRCFW